MLPEPESRGTASQLSHKHTTRATEREVDARLSRCKNRNREGRKRREDRLRREEPSSSFTCSSGAVEGGKTFTIQHESLKTDHLAELIKFLCSPEHCCDLFSFLLLHCSLYPRRSFFFAFLLTFLKNFLWY